MAQNKQVVTRLVERFRTIQVSVKIQDEADKGNYINTNVAEEMLADELFGVPEVTEESEYFIDQSFNKYILKVEKYDGKQLIARAYDRESGLIKAQTAPSYFSSSKELIEEIKNILNQT